MNTFPVKGLDALDAFPSSGEPRLLLDIIGTNGSGKSTFPHFLVANDPATYIVSWPFEDWKANATICPTYNFAMVGKYVTQCGGADTSKTKSTNFEVLERLLPTDLHIIIEGIMVTDTTETYWEVLEGISSLLPWRKSLIIKMDYTFQTCLDRIHKRNGGKPVNDEAILGKFNRSNNRALIYEDRIRNGSPVRLHREATEGINPMIISILNVIDTMLK